MTLYTLLLSPCRRLRFKSQGLKRGRVNLYRNFLFLYKPRLVLKRARLFKYKKLSFFLKKWLFLARPFSYVESVLNSPFLESTSSAFFHCGLIQPQTLVGYYYLNRAFPRVPFDNNYQATVPFSPLNTFYLKQVFGSVYSGGLHRKVYDSYLVARSSLAITQNIEKTLPLVYNLFFPKFQTFLEQQKRKIVLRKLLQRSKKLSKKHYLKFRRFLRKIEPFSHREALEFQQLLRQSRVLPSILRRSLARVLFKESNQKRHYRYLLRVRNFMSLWKIYKQAHLNYDGRQRKFSMFLLWLRFYIFNLQSFTSDKVLKPQLGKKKEAFLRYFTKVFRQDPISFLILSNSLEWEERLYDLLSISRALTSRLKVCYLNKEVYKKNYDLIFTKYYERSLSSAWFPMKKKVTFFSSIKKKKQQLYLLKQKKVNLRARKLKLFWRFRNYDKAYFNKRSPIFLTDRSFFVKIKHFPRTLWYKVKSKKFKGGLKTLGYNLDFYHKLFPRNLKRNRRKRYLYFLSKTGRKLPLRLQRQSLKKKNGFRRGLRRNLVRNKKSLFKLCRQRYRKFRKRIYFQRYRWSMFRRVPIKVLLNKRKRVSHKFFKFAKRLRYVNKFYKNMFLYSRRAFVKKGRRLLKAKVWKVYRTDYSKYKPVWSVVRSPMLFPRRLSFRQDQKKKRINHLRRPLYTNLLHYQKHFRSFFFDLTLNQIKQTVRRSVRLYGRNFYNFLLLLEYRLDNFLYRINYAKNYQEARELVKTGEVFVNLERMLDYRKTVARSALVQVKGSLKFNTIFNRHSISLAQLLLFLGICRDYKSIRLLLKNRRFILSLLGSSVGVRYASAFITGEKMLFSSQNRFFLFSTLKYTLLHCKSSKDLLESSIPRLVVQSKGFFDSQGRCFLYKTKRSSSRFTLNFYKNSYHINFKRYKRKPSGAFLLFNKNIYSVSLNKAFSLFSFFASCLVFNKKRVVVNLRQLLFKSLRCSIQFRELLLSKEAIKSGGFVSGQSVYNAFLVKQRRYRPVSYREENRARGAILIYRNPLLKEISYPFPVVLFFIYYYFRRFS